MGRKKGGWIPAELRDSEYPGLDASEWGIQPSLLLKANDAQVEGGSWSVKLSLVPVTGLSTEHCRAPRDLSPHL